MPKIISKIAIDELSLMAHGYKGKNADAVTLATKGEAVKPSFLDRVASMFGANKSDATGSAQLTEKGWLIPDDVVLDPDNINPAGDGAEDYSQVADMIMSAYYDISAAFGISGDSARVSAVVAAIDVFIANFDDLRAGGDGRVAKGGKRHSKSDQDTIDKIGEHAAAITDLHAKLNAAPDKTDDATEKGAEEAAAADVVIAAPAEAAPAAQPAAETVATAPEAVPAAAEPVPALDPKAIAAAAAEAVLDAMRPLVDTLKGEVTTQLTAHALAVDAKLATVTARVDDVAAKGESTQSALQLSAASAAAAARQPSAPGGIAVRTGDLATTKGAPITADTVAVEITPDMTAAQALRSVFRAGQPQQ